MADVAAHGMLRRLVERPMILLKEAAAAAAVLTTQEAAVVVAQRTVVLTAQAPPASVDQTAMMAALAHAQRLDRDLRWQLLQ